MGGERAGHGEIRWQERDGGLAESEESVEGRLHVSSIAGVRGNMAVFGIVGRVAIGGYCAEQVGHKQVDSVSWMKGKGLNGLAQVL